MNRRIIAYYLPQFHRIPENDLWWGEGFTEWTNVRKARPLFAGHRQPKIPGELGYYDLTHSRTRVRQAELAAQYGVDGFCYWHYWFGNGRRLLDRPFCEVLASGEPDFPFCLCWANQSWTGVWHGAPGKVLIEQLYPGSHDLRAHFDALAPAFEDARYIKIDGKPIFSVYSPDSLPDAEAFTHQWREMAQSRGYPGIFLVGLTNSFEPVLDCVSHFDAISSVSPGDYLEYERKLAYWQKILKVGLSKRGAGRISDSARKALRLPWRLNYDLLVRNAFSRVPKDGRYLPCVLPNWDNTPRSGYRGVVLEGTSPAAFAGYLEKANEFLNAHPSTANILFVKAWNEWAEGNYLEPDREYGTGWLDAIRSVKNSFVPGRMISA